MQTGLFLTIVLMAQFSSSDALKLGKIMPTDNILLPKCFEEMTPADLRNMDWCNPKFAPNNSPPPKKLQGLYWMQWGAHANLIHDVAVCMSNAEWIPEKQTMRMAKNWEHFIFKTDQAGLNLAVANQLTGMHYDFPCRDNVDRRGRPREGGSTCSIKVMGRDTIGTKAWDALHFFSGSRSLMKLEEIVNKSEPEGEAWLRITDTRGTLEMAVERGKEDTPHEYPWVRIMDGDMNIREERFKEMVQHYNESGVEKIIRYTDRCDDSGFHLELNQKTQQRQMEPYRRRLELRQMDKSAQEATSLLGP